MVGSAIHRMLISQGFTNLIVSSHKDLDLTNQNCVNEFLMHEKPDCIYLAAARVGGVYANNTYPADFIYSNLMVELNVIHGAFLAGTSKLLFLGSSCIYPKNSTYPIQENQLLTGKLEPTNEPYAIAKIAGIKLCESYNRQYGLDYRSIMPTNLYGPGDNYHELNSHVIPGLIRRFHNAKQSKLKEVTVWGTGKARREFLYVDDLANAAVFVMNLSKEIYERNTKPMESHLNVGYGEDLTIFDLSAIVAKIVGFEGKIIFDASKPDGVMRKLIDSKKIFSLGWSPNINLETGLEFAYQDFLMTHSSGLSREV